MKMKFRNLIICLVLLLTTLVGGIVFLSTDFSNSLINKEESNNPSTEAVVTYSVTVGIVEATSYSAMACVYYKNSSNQDEEYWLAAGVSETTLTVAQNSILKIGGFYEEGVNSPIMIDIFDGNSQLQDSREGTLNWVQVSQAIDGGHVDIHIGTPWDTTGPFLQTIKHQVKTSSGSYIDSSSGGDLSFSGYASNQGNNKYHVGSQANFRISASNTDLYIFDGFYTELAQGIVPVSEIYSQSGNTFNYTPCCAMTIYARWTPVEQCVVKIYAGDGIDDITQPGIGWGEDGGGRYKQMEAFSGQSITVAVKVHPARRFVNWVNDNTKEVLSTSTTYTFTLTSSIVLKANADFWFDINSKLDGVYETVEHNYATFDMYIDNVRVANAVSDFNGYFLPGQKYEIKNIVVGVDKVYVGTEKGSLSGTISHYEGAEIILEFRTKTWEDYAASSYASGNGTEASPYIIKTPEQLGKLAKDSRTSNMLGKYFKLGGNIDLSAHIWSGISQTTQITANTFQGTFDGDMYTIKNIKTSVDFYLPHHGGLFGRTNSKATVKNLIIQGGEIRGKGDSGALVGNGQGSCVNVIVDGAKVTSDTDAAGGIAGTLRGTLKTSVCRDSTIIGALYTGGLVSYCGATVTNCSVINTIVGSASKGYGILGTMIEDGTFNSSYGQGTVNSMATKQMYGDSSAWGNWSYSPLLNGGYPVQKTLFAIGGLTGSQNVYDYLTGTLKFSVA